LTIKDLSNDLSKDFDKSFQGALTINATAPTGRRRVRRQKRRRSRATRCLNAADPFSDIYAGNESAGTKVDKAAVKSRYCNIAIAGFCSDRWFLKIWQPMEICGAATNDLPIPQTVSNLTDDAEEQARLTIYRDVKDVRLIRSLSITALLQAFLLVISFATIVYLSARPPQQIVIERSAEGDRVVAVNGQAVKNGIVLGADKPGAGDKQTLAREWTAARYAVDPLTREKDMEKMFRLMDPHAAKAYSDLLKKQGSLERERNERWQAVWKPQLVEIDKGDPYQVNVVGIWEVTKVSKGGSGATEREVKQLMFALHLIKDTDQGRAPRNAQTGFLIDDILDYKELPVAVSSSTSALEESQ
jgi:hypothetical protein